VSKELERVHAVAREKKGERFTALFHHVNVARLRRAFEQMSKDAAPGVDGETWQTYGEHLEENLDPLVKSPAGLGLNGRTPNFAQASHGGSSIFEEVLVRGGVFTRASSLGDGGVA